jgi:hypothetical protein
MRACAGVLCGFGFTGKAEAPGWSLHVCAGDTRVRANFRVHARVRVCACAAAITFSASGRPTPREMTKAFTAASVTPVSISAAPCSGSAHMHG